MALFGRAPGSSNAILDAVRASLPRQLPNLDAHTLEKLKTQALAKARALRLQASQSRDQMQALGNDLADSQGVHEAGSKAWRLYRRAECSAAARALARALICLFFANEVLDAYQRWQHLQTPAMRYELAPHRARPNCDAPPSPPPHVL